MRRRTILKSLLALGSVAVPGFRLPLAQVPDERGKFFVFVQAEGGWDPTSFCDPKVNQKGERVINRWAKEGLREDDLPRAGKIRYAPWAHNKAFFEAHHDKMLVINGVDAQTNSHTTGVVHNWSGRSSEGYPTMSALLAARYGPDLPVAYLNFGGYSETAGIARYTRLNNADLLRNIATPTVDVHEMERRYVSESDWTAIRRWREEDTAAWRADSAPMTSGTPVLLPLERESREFYRSAVVGSERLEAYAASIPSEGELIEGERGRSASNGILWSDLERQAQLAVLAFKTGAAVSADFVIYSFDTHATHDDDHMWLLGKLTDGVDCLWEYAEQHEVADDLVVVMGSDFGRTNHYNSQKGKDHWPYGSFIVMEKNQSWTDRVVGETNELHHAYNIDPSTLERVGDSDPNGTHIYPKHVHKALRRYLGIENSPGAQRFPFNNTEDFAFFG